MRKCDELKERFKLARDRFTADLRDEVMAAGLGDIPEPLIEYIYKIIEPLLNEIADEIADEAASWLSSRARKIKLWLRRHL